MSAALVRLNKNRRCATPNSEKPVSGTLIALVIVLVLCFAVATDMPRLIAMVIS